MNEPEDEPEDEPDTCDCCATHEPLGELHKCRQFRKPVWLCDFCYKTYIGSSFLADRQERSEIILAQCMNLLREIVTNRLRKPKKRSEQ